MRVRDLFEHEDDEHFAAHRETGFFGRQGAGCLLYARDSQRFLLSHRSADVEQPGTWGIWGGAINSAENPLAAAVREAKEECGYNGPISAVPLYVHEAEKDGKAVFRYFNFLAVVPTEFTPQLNWESQGYKWCAFGAWPSNLHFGLRALFNDASSMRKINEIMLDSSG